MMNLQNKSESINAMLYDLRAEFMVSCLLDEGIPARDILTFFDGVLKRKWSTDVHYAEKEVFESGKEALTLHLNRAGIYDSLPEALFHRLSGSRDATGVDMAKESMELKAEEKQARTFFRPFEHEIFFQRVRVALKETREFQGLFSDSLNGLVPGFWKTDKRIPTRYAGKLIKVLPFAHQIAGKYDLTAQCLELILEEEVKAEYTCGEIAEKPGDERVFSGVEAGRLGKSKLGTDFLTGSTASGFTGRILFRIGPLKTTRPNDFFKGGPADLLLGCFFDFFIPVELETEVKVQVEASQQKFVLSGENETEESHLGYNTVL